MTDPRHQSRPRGFVSTCPRLRQLIQLADDGDPEAPGDLLREYGFVYGIDEALTEHGQQTEKRGDQ